MAHRAGKSSTKLGRDSQPKYLGVKLYAGEKVLPGNIIIRQRGTKFRPGSNTKLGVDDTIYATKQGSVKFRTKKITRFDGNKKFVKFVDVISH